MGARYQFYEGGSHEPPFSFIVISFIVCCFDSYTELTILFVFYHVYVQVHVCVAFVYKYASTCLSVRVCMCKPVINVKDLDCSSWYMWRWVL